MTTSTLNADFLRELSVVAEDDGMLKKLSAYMHRLIRKKQDDTLMTEEDFRAKLERSSAEAAAGHYVEKLPDESIDQFVDRLLCM